MLRNYCHRPNFVCLETILMETFTYGAFIFSLPEKNVSSDRDCHPNLFSTHCRDAVHMANGRIPTQESIRRLRIYRDWSIEDRNALLTGGRRSCDLLRKPKFGWTQALVPFLFCARHKGSASSSFDTDVVSERPTESQALHTLKTVLIQGSGQALRVNLVGVTVPQLHKNLRPISTLGKRRNGS